MAEVIVVHGYAGSGKTTQCERVAKEGLLARKVQHLSVGNHLRDIKNQRTSSTYASYLNSPLATSPPPDEVINGIVSEAIENTDPSSLLLIDGYPRSVYTVNEFYKNLEVQDHKLIGTVDFDVSLSVSEKRILERGPREGEDYSDEVLKSYAAFRFNRHRQTAHLAILALSNYAPIETIVANGDKDEVYERFTAALGKLVLEASAQQD